MLTLLPTFWSGGMVAGIRIVWSFSCQGNDFDFDSSYYDQSELLRGKFHLQTPEFRLQTFSKRNTNSDYVLGRNSPTSRPPVHPPVVGISMCVVWFV